MSHALTIEPSSNVVGGFKQENPDIAGIPESANISGTLLNKLGTSIPTPFARLHLFNSAFKEINASGSAFSSTAAPNYQKLVSLALDTLEFLYLYGASSELSLIRWNVDQQAQALKNSPLPGHSGLGEALLSAWNNANYMGRDIILIKYGNDIIGGTSPLSLFYTNPNLTKTFPGLSNGHRLFDTNSPLPLKDRSKEFKEYVYKLYKTYTSAFTGTEIGQYIADNLNRDVNDDLELANMLNKFAAQTPQQMEQSLKNGFQGSQTYIPLQINNTALIIGKGITMWVKDLANINFQSDYKIKPSQSTYANISVNGAQKTLRTPLVLNEFGIGAARYVDNTYWAAGSLTPGDVQIPLYERKLPGTEITYPYLRSEDFFQDKIIQLSYNIHKDKFHTGLEEDTTFLLPLKREFFKYFSPQELKDMYSLDVAYSPDGLVEKITATLNIPLESGQKLPLSKTYSKEEGEIVSAMASANTFNIAFFPFFKDKAKNVKNEYDVMLVASADETNLRFYDLEKPDEAFQNVFQASTGEQGEIKREVRTKKENGNTLQSIHYNVNKPFDIVEVSFGTDFPAYGLVLPKLREVNTTNPSADYVFGVDFGTTNTQVAYSCNNGSIDSFNIRLDSEDEELQTIYLNNHSVKDGKHLIGAGFGMFTDFADMARREFVTSEMSPDLFPIRTAVCEVSSLDTVQHPRLFGAINIGFNYTNEMTTGTGANRYITDLKWDTSNTHTKERIRVFFQELLLLMRNKSVLNGGKRNIKVAVTYPQAMNGRVENDFRNAWREAAETIGLDGDNIKFHFESIAPYYSFSRVLGLNKPYVNMDIGGGSTDIFYHNKDTNEKLTFSVMFAGNDIWGDGCNPLLEGGRNGFIKQYEASDYFKNLPSNLKNDYEMVKKNSSRGSTEGFSQRSSDIINYLFKNDNVFRFTDAIRNSKMILLPILHFTSLIYYLAHIAESQDVDLPKILSFTGMGSLYLKMLGNGDQLSQLAATIIDFQTKKNGSELTILFAANPKKVTAEGAVTISLAHTKGIELIKTDSALCYGIEEEEPDTRLNVGNVRDNQIRGEKLSDLVLSHYDEIIELLKSNERFRETLSNMGFDTALNSLPSKQDLKDIFDDSMTTCLQKYKTDHKEEEPNNRLKESLFFWPLKDGLYKLGIDLTKDLKI
ncbi:MAG: hypothetical protein K2J82_06280 [Muribaculaceae bacterium]|nr:hypothetical protein [Muribaculaceae bacterium]